MKGRFKKSRKPVYEWTPEREAKVKDSLKVYRDNRRKFILDNPDMDEKFYPPNLTLDDIKEFAHDSDEVWTWRRRLESPKVAKLKSVKSDNPRNAWMEDVTEYDMRSAAMNKRIEEADFDSPRKLAEYYATGEMDRLDAYIEQERDKGFTARKFKASSAGAGFTYSGILQVLLDSIERYWGNTWQGQHIQDIIKRMRKNDPEYLQDILYKADDEATPQFYYEVYKLRGDKKTRDRLKGKRRKIKTKFSKHESTLGMREAFEKDEKGNEVGRIAQAVRYWEAAERHEIAVMGPRFDRRRRNNK